MATFQFIVRTVLALALIYGVYTETGKWTALFAFLVFVALEAQGFINKKKK